MGGENGQTWVLSNYGMAPINNAENLVWHIFVVLVFFIFICFKDNVERKDKCRSFGNL